MKKNKIISVLLALVFVLSLFVSSCSGNSGKTVMKIGGNDIGYDEYRYYYMNFKKSQENNPDLIIKDEIEKSIRKKYAVVDMANEYNFKLSVEGGENVQKNMDSFAQYYGGKSKLKETLKKSYMNVDLLKSSFEIMELETELRKYSYQEQNGVILSDDATVEKYIKENFIRALQILIRNDPGENIADNKKTADGILEKIHAGEDFYTLFEQYNEDTDVTLPDGYYFVRGQLLEEFETTAVSLEIGQISDVVRSSTGYHIIIRLGLEDDYINENFEKLRDVFLVKMFNTMLEERAEDLQIEYTDYYNKLTDEIIAGEKSK